MPVGSELFQVQGDVGGPASSFSCSFVIARGLAISIIQESQVVLEQTRCEALERAIYTN